MPTVGTAGRRELHRPSFIVWGSGGGSTFRALGEAIGQGIVDAEIPLVITDKPQAGILNHVTELRTRYGFDTQVTVINRDRFPGGPAARGQTRQEADQTGLILDKYPNSILALLGCMRILHSDVLAGYGWRPEWATEHPITQGKYRTRIVNTHPGIVPQTADTHGLLTQARVLELGLPQTAHTLLAVGGGIDGGPVLAEHLIDVPEYDLTTAALRDQAAHDLFALVQQVEKAELPHDLVHFAAQREEHYGSS